MRSAGGKESRDEETNKTLHVIIEIVYIEKSNYFDLFIGSSRLIRSFSEFTNWLIHLVQPL